jgi:hypothetical protein
MHRSAGLAVSADGPIEVGTNVAMNAPRPLGSVDVTCRIVAVIDESNRYGFAYRTLSVHPERREEAFAWFARIAARGSKSMQSVPAHPLARIVPFATDWLQDRAVRRCLAAIERIVRNWATHNGSSRAVLGVACAAAASRPLDHGQRDPDRDHSDPKARRTDTGNKKRRSNEHQKHGNPHDSSHDVSSVPLQRGLGGLTIQGPSVTLQSADRQVWRRAGRPLRTVVGENDLSGSECDDALQRLAGGFDE